MTKKTRRKNGTGSIRPHGNGYEASVYVNGKRLVFHVKTRAQAEAVIRQAVQVNIAMARKGNPNSISDTVEEFSIEWLQRITDLKQNTQYGHERILHLYILPFFGNRLVSEMTTQDVQVFIENLKIENKSAKTIKNIVSVLSAIMSDAVRHNILPINPVRGGKIPRVTNIGKTPQVICLSSTSPFLGSRDDSICSQTKP